MIRRLVDADIVRRSRTVTPGKSRFWLRECRSPEILAELVTRYVRPARVLARSRSAVACALRGDAAAVAEALRAEELREREADRRYWIPLRAELEQWRLQRPRRP